MVLRYGVLLCATVLTLWCPPLARANEVTLDQAVAIAFESNPDLAAAASELTITGSEIQRANYVSQFNPQIWSDGEYRHRQGQANSQDWRVALTQEFEIFGQKRLRRESAQLAYQRSAEELKNQHRLLAAAVKMTFYEALRARNRTELLAELEALDSKLAKLATARFDAGEIGQIDLNLTQVRFGESQRALIDGREAYHLQRSSLGRLLGGAVGAEPVPSAEMHLEPPRDGLEQLVSAARANRPDLKAARDEVARLKVEAQLNQRLALPNPTVGTFLGHEQNTERFIGGTVGFSIPLFNRRQAEATAIGGRLAQSQSRLRATELNLEREVRDAYGRYVEARRALNASSEYVVAPARESFGLLEEAFQAGKLDLLSLSVAERQAFEARIGYLDAWFNCAAAGISLELAVGGSI
jgi:outer membrane protein, heavy metal efflux system